MKSQKDKLNELIFSAVGQIDDRLIADAQTPDRARASVRAKQRYLQMSAVAACIALAVTGGGLLYGRSKPQTELSDNSTSAAEKSEARTLAEVLTEAEKTNLSLEVAPESINFYDGNMSVIWRQKGADSVHTLEVSEKNKAMLVSSVKSQAAAQLTAEQADAVEYEIWVCMGDGRVLSPQLRYSEGNIGQAELFRYSPEQEPSEHFTKAVYSLIKPT